jgi:hypothetical protein
MIPLPEESTAVFKSVNASASSKSISEWTDFFRGRALSLEPNSTHRIEVEFQVYTTAFLRLVVRNQHRTGSVVKFTYSEAYENPAAPYTSRKTVRTAREGNVLQGPSDSYQFSGSDETGNIETFEPFWWKAFRFIVMDFSVGSSPLELLEFQAKQTNYPIQETASWEDITDPQGAKMMEISMRTMKMCMFDGYSDCPFYEQLQ